MLQRNVTASGALHRLTRAFPFLSVLGGHLKILPSLYTRETKECCLNTHAQPPSHLYLSVSSRLIITRYS